MRLVLLINMILLFILLYSLKKMKLNPKAKNIYIIIFIGLMLINGFVLHNYVQVKSVYNYSTYMTYENILYNFKDVERYEINDVSDIRDFSFILEGLCNQSALLAYQLEYSILVEEENDILKDNLFSLSDELHKFVIHHSRLYANSIEIPDDNISLYNELKSNISEFGRKIGKESENAGGNIIGIVEYRIKLKEKGLNELDMILDSISEINASIMK